MTMKGFKYNDMEVNSFRRVFTLARSSAFPSAVLEGRYRNIPLSRNIMYMPTKGDPVYKAHAMRRLIWKSSPHCWIRFLVTQVKPDIR